jgi:hypothetical protein
VEADDSAGLVRWMRVGGMGAVSLVPRVGPHQRGALAPAHEGNGGVKQAGDSGSGDWEKIEEALVGEGGASRR